MSPAAKVLIPFGFGILLGVRLSPPPALALLVGLLSLSIGLWLYVKRRDMADPFLLSVFLLTGASLGSLSLTSPHLEPFFGSKITFQGEVLRAHIRPYGVRIYCSGRINGGPKVRLVLVSEERIILRRGDRIVTKGTLNRPQPSRNPGSFDRRRYLAAQGIYGELRVKRIEKLPPTGLSIRRSAELLRGKIESLSLKLFPRRHALLVAGMILGDRERLPDEMEEIFRRSGLSHLLAVSGLHVGMLSSVCFFSLGLLRIPRKMVSALTILIVVAYAVVVGLRPSVVRTTIVVTLVLVGYMIDRDVNLMNLLAVAAMGMLTLRPQMLWDVGFQLTFAVTASIIYLMPRWERAWMRLNERWRRRWPISWIYKLIILPIMVTLSAQIGSLPITAYRFHQIHPWGLIPNLAAVWLLWAVVGLTPIVSTLALIWLPLAYPFAAVEWLALEALERLTGWASSLPRATLFVSKPALWQILLYGLLALAVANFGHLRRNPGRWILITASTLTISVWHFALSWPGRLTEVTFLDVGYGSAVFIKAAGGKTALVNAGPRRGRFDTGRTVIEPFLRHRGVGGLDLVIATGERLTLIGGLRHIERRFKIGRLILPDQRISDDIELGRRGSAMIWHIPAGEGLIVVKLRYGDVGFLLAGSLDREGQRWLMERGTNLKAHVIEVPRHGSKRGFNPAFLERVAPIMGVISVGPNPFHLPSQEVIEGYRAMGIEVLRTDESGAVMILTDGRRGWISTHL
jgi:competence protein ComEC